MQWNVNGLQSRLHLGEIQHLLKEFEPLAVCLQDVNKSFPTIGKYKLASSSLPEDGNLGTAIYLHNKVFHDSVVINNAELQLSALKLQLSNNNTFLVHNVYNQPNKHYDHSHLSRLLDLQGPVLLMGDLNAHNPIWDRKCSSPDTNGVLLEQFIIANDLCCLNENDCSTYFSNTHGTLSAVDVTICSPSIVDRIEWHVCDDMCSSDHFPILISFLQHTPDTHAPRYNIGKADWVKYQLHTRDIPPFDRMKDHNDSTEFLTKFIHGAAANFIPLSFSLLNRQKVPWWSETLSELIHKKHSVGRRLDALNRLILSFKQ